MGGGGSGEDEDRSESERAAGWVSRLSGHVRTHGYEDADGDFTEAS